MLITKVNPGPHGGFVGRISSGKHRHQSLKNLRDRTRDPVMADEDVFDLFLPSIVHLFLVTGHHDCGEVLIG